MTTPSPSALENRRRTDGSLSFTAAPATPVLAAPAQSWRCIPTRVPHWYGKATGHWFAVVPWPWAEQRALLVEADTEEALVRAVWQLLAKAG